MADVWVLTFSHDEYEYQENIVLGVFGSLEDAQRAVDRAYDPCDDPSWRLAAAPYRSGHFRTPRSDAVAGRAFRGEYEIECIELGAVQPEYPLPPLPAREEQPSRPQDGLVAKLWAPLFIKSMRANTTLPTIHTVTSPPVPEFVKDENDGGS